jgi:hypothetical protein
VHVSTLEVHVSALSRTRLEREPQLLRVRLLDGLERERLRRLIDVIAQPLELLGPPAPISRAIASERAAGSVVASSAISAPAASREIPNAAPPPRTMMSFFQCAGLVTSRS